MELTLSFTDEENEILEGYKKIRCFTDEECIADIKNILLSGVKSKYRVKKESNTSKRVKESILHMVSGGEFFIAPRSFDSFYDESGSGLSKEYHQYVIGLCLPMAVCQYAVGRYREEYLLDSIHGTLRLNDSVYYRFHKLVERARKYQGQKLVYNDSFKSAENLMTELLNNLPDGVKSVYLISRIFDKSKHGAYLPSRAWVKDDMMYVSISIERHT